MLERSCWPAANNSFTGGTQLLAGTLRVAVTDFFGATPQPLTINFGTAFDIGGFNQHVTTLTVVDGSVLNGAGNTATLNGHRLRRAERAD